MANQHNDDIPAAANTIASDWPKVAQNIGYHKDVFQVITSGWANQGIDDGNEGESPIIVPSRNDWAMVDETSVTFGSTTYPLASGIHRVTAILDLGVEQSIYLRFNGDFQERYLVFLRDEYDGATASAGSSSDTAADGIMLATSALNRLGTHIIEILFATNPSDAKQAIVQYSTSLMRSDSPSYRAFLNGMGFYSGVRDIYKFSFMSAQGLSGTMNGNLIWERIG